jgi:uncharacterized membrane-anchored protein YjiN (DUF445 family)
MRESEASLAERLRRMQWLASGLVAVMAVVFVAASLWRGRFPALNLVWAFSEAALIGGLADWFAVTALFRRPLGLPIPHTAIVPTRKNEIGRALARFIGEHFLVRAAIEARLARTNLSSRLGHWLEHGRNSQRLSRDLGVALEWLLRAVDTEELRESLQHGLSDALDRVPVHEAIATLIDVLASGNHAQTVIDQLVHFGRDLLEQNREKIRLRIRDRSPWWLPRFVDEEIYGQLVREIERILNEIGDDPSHPARGQFNERLRQMKDAFASDAELIEKSRTLRNEFLRHPATRDYFADVGVRVREFVLESFRDPDSGVRLGIERQLRAIGRALADDPTIAERLNRWLREAVIYIVENYRSSLTEIVSDTVAQWDAGETSRRIELHIGRDLQFIRINGTLVGGLVGVFLYLLWQQLLSL